jgi:hypothetical protein
MLYHGRCHCGSIGYSYSTERLPGDWTMRACQCSFCRAHGACTTSDPGGSVEYLIKRADQLQRYRFGLNITEFLICRTCGAYVGAVTEVSSVLLAVVNCNVLHPHPLDLPEALPVSHDGESIDARNRRRQAAWTPCRGIVEGVRASGR